MRSTSAVLTRSHAVSPALTVGAAAAAVVRAEEVSAAPSLTRIDAREHLVSSVFRAVPEKA